MVTRADEAMARKLRAAGWRVEPPLTQENCKHDFRTTSGGAGSTDGYTEWACHVCGKRERQEWQIDERVYKALQFGRAHLGRAFRDLPDDLPRPTKSSTR